MKRRFLLVTLALAIVGLGSQPPSEARPTTRAGTAAVATAAPPASQPTLVWLNARHRGSTDRVVFGFTDGLPHHVDATWTDTLVHDGSGLPVRVAGTKVLALVFHGAVAHDQGAPTTRIRTAFALPNVITAVQAGDFEATVTFGLGVQEQTSYRVTTRSNPDRVVVDVQAGYPTTTRKVGFLDRDAFATGQEPYVVPVSRPVPAAAPAAGALHALFAGPRPVELADGLRMVRSGASSFADLRIADRIARVRLTHGCGSGGSTFTVAEELVPTLKQFPSVDWVKIYDPAGHTESPAGDVDSIPTCLEP